MKKALICILSVFTVGSLCAFVGCAEDDGLPAVVVNGGFESGDLSGWTVEYGDAYDNDSVSSRKTFSYSVDVDPHGYVIPVNHTGNWYLSGRGFDNTRPSSCTGAIRSQNFVLGGDGNISMKLAGGAQAMSRSDTAEQKPAAEVCYVGIYHASDDKMIAYQTNRYFAEDASNIELVDYENGTCYTDNFCQYKIDLSNYIGEELYIRIVDNDTNYYYGYLSVDDIRIGKDAEPQAEGEFFAKTAERGSATAATVYDIANGDFEAGSLAGWEICDGLAFSDDGVNCDPYWWAEQIPYEREGNFHYGYYNPAATGAMKSSTFVVGGTGYVTYKLGGCSDNNRAYLRFMKVVDGGEDVQILRVSNFAFKDMQFPNVQNGLRVINLNQYRVNLSAYMGERMYIEVVDENSSADMAGCVVLDSVKTYHEQVPQFTDWFDVPTEIIEDIPVKEGYQIVNGGFETGDLTGWIMEGNIGEVTDKTTWWNEGLPFNKNGEYHFSGLENEGGTGTLTTAQPFTVGGACKMTFSLGGAHDPRFCYVSLLNENFEEVARYSNPLFHDAGLGLINKGTNLANMVSYWADLSEWQGQKLYIRITDNATSNWGLVTADSFVTYYEPHETNRFPANPFKAENILNRSNPPASEYQIENGNFETGNLDGWELSGNIGNVSFKYLWFNEWFTFNKSGLFFFSGFEGNEGDRGTLTSSPFTVGGTGMITYRLGGGMDTSLCYIDIVDAETDCIYYRFGNEKYRKNGGVYTPGVPVTVGCEGHGANMLLYKADLSKLSGRKVRIRIVDKAVKDWGLMFVDDFVTYYADEGLIPENAIPATDLLTPPYFEDIDRKQNIAQGNNSVVLNPVNHNDAYTYSFALVGEYEDIVLEGNVIKIVPEEELNLQFKKLYELKVKITLTNTFTGSEEQLEISVRIEAVYDNRQILNGDFETGDLTGWTVTEGNVSTGDAVFSAETFWGENITYNQGGKYHFDGWSANGVESDAYSLRSSDFILDGSGYISFKMGGRAAVLKVYRSNGEQIAEYENSEFANVNFPHVDEGLRLATMTTFVADLSDYIGEKLYIEICDVKTDKDWGVAFFDDIVTYYENIPDVSKLSDTVKLNKDTSSTETDCEYELKWVIAQNKLN